MISIKIITQWFLILILCANFASGQVLPDNDNLVLNLKLDSDRSLDTSMIGKISYNNITSTYDRHGIAGGAALLSGRRASMEIDNIAWGNRIAFTVSFWFKSLESKAGDHSIIGNYRVASSNGWGLFLNSNKLMSWYFGKSGNTFNVESGNVVAELVQNRWHLLTAVYSKDATRVYLDGQLRGNFPWAAGGPSVSNSDAKINIGQYQGDARYIHGAIDDLMIFSKTLSTGEIQALYEAQSDIAYLVDSDGDGLTDGEEMEIGSNSMDPDSDGDGLSDGFEAGSVRYNYVFGDFTWDEASNLAKSQGKHLVTITSHNELNIIKSKFSKTIEETQKLNRGAGSFMWIGATDREAEGVFRWVTGEQFKFSRWLPGEPNNAYLGENYAVMGAFPDGVWKWNDYKESFEAYGFPREKVPMDQISAIIEDHFPSNVLLPDTDGDGLDDGDEYVAKTNPNLKDTDGDGVEDGTEVSGGLDPNNGDTDQDGFGDNEELIAGTDPLAPDTDGDGLDDGHEFAYGTNPLIDDSDNDGYNDGIEVQHGTDPTSDKSAPEIMSAYTAIELEFGTTEGINYQLQHSPDLVTWSDQGEPFVGLGGNMQVFVSIRGTDKNYFRLVKVSE